MMRAYPVVGRRFLCIKFGIGDVARNLKPGAESVAWIEAEREFIEIGLKVLRADTVVNCIRSHWGIENKLHHVLDRSLEEDASRIRKNPGIFATLRQFYCNILICNK